MSPRVTFLMAVYNGAATLPAAVESVLAQTFRDLELLIIDDGSTDASPEILRRFNDPRIRVATNERNLGLSASLNRGIDLLRGGEFVARMDADDICLPQRAANQLAFLEANPGVAVVGSFIETFSDDGGGGVVVKYPTEPDAVSAALLFRSALAHPTVMWRRHAMNALRYENEFRYSQDYALWMRCLAAGLKLANLPEVLLKYRLHAGQLSHDDQRMQAEGTAIRSRFLRWLAQGISQDELSLHDALSRDLLIPQPAWMSAAAAWLEKLAALNEARPVFSRQALMRALTGRYVALLRCAHQHRLHFPESPSTIFAPYIHPDTLQP